jgi:integrase
MFVTENNGWLVLKFKYGEVWYAEYLSKKATRDNERVAKRTVRALEDAMIAGNFVKEFARRFPNSTNLTRLGFALTDDLRLGEFAIKWLEERKPPILKPASYNHYRVMLKNHLLGLPIASKRIVEVDDGDVNLLIGVLQEKFGEESGKRTINMVLSRLRSIFATAKLRKLIAEDPMKFVKNLRLSKPRVDPFDLQEALALVEAAEGWERTFIVVLIFTGMRPNEALALRWTKVDWRHDIIKVHDNIGWRGRVGSPKTESSERDVEMIGTVRKALQEQRARSELKGDLVFPSASGTPINLDNFRARSWLRIQRRASVRPRTIYQCRHTFARLAIEHGDTPQHVAAQLGHANTRMVLTVYANWFERPKSAAMEALDRAVSVTHPSPIFGGKSAGSDGRGR